MHIGIDIVEMEEFEKSSGSSVFLKRVFTEKEIKSVSEYIAQRKKESLAGKFAAKEAVVKALGTGFSGGICPTDIEILNDSNGKPTLNLYNTALIEYRNLNIKGSDISITHSNNFAIAVVALV